MENFEQIIDTRQATWKLYKDPETGLATGLSMEETNHRIIFSEDKKIVEIDGKKYKLVEE